MKLPKSSRTINDRYTGWNYCRREPIVLGQCGVGGILSYDGTLSVSQTISSD